MIDVVFLLLIFFLLTSAATRPMLPLNLPEAQHASSSQEAPVIVAIKIDGSLYVNNDAVDLKDLPTKLTSLYKQTGNKDLNLMSDKSVPFGRVVEVMDIAQETRVYNIAVVTEQKIQ